MSATDHIGSPVFVPEGRSQVARLVAEAFASLKDTVVAGLLAFLDDRSREGFLSLEQRTLQLFASMSTQAVAGILAMLHRDDRWVSDAIEAERHRADVALRHRGSRPTRVRFLSGAVLSLETPYLSENMRHRPGPIRGVGRRGESGGGRYPVLEALGVMNRVTPALASEVAREAARTASFEEAREALADRGIAVTRETVRSLTLKVGEEALRQRDARIEAAATGATFSEEFEGERIVISTDGGRLRLREGGQHGRKSKKTRRRRFRTPWREPKLVTAYLIDKKGRKRRDAAPLYDGTLGGADAAFDILIAELKLRGAAKAKQIILVGDGALWIWNRADELGRRLGIDPKRIVKVADFYHAVEHLTAIADLRANWDDDQKKKWVKHVRRMLREGGVDDVIAEARGFCVGRNAGKIATEIEYFVTRRDFMQYAKFAKRGVPLGSGGMESAVRRVVNLRLKGASIFWRDRSAECMLHLRSYLKAGRWRELIARVMHRSPDGKPTLNAARDAA